jgi:hypothetical protein
LWRLHQHGTTAGEERLDPQMERISISIAFIYIHRNLLSIPMTTGIT